MSDIKEIEIVKDEKPLTPQTRLSPTSINTFMKCPRQYFYTYIAKLKTKPSIDLLKGSMIHKTLEDFYRDYKPDMQGHIISLFEKNWESNKQNIKDLELPIDKETQSKADCISILGQYIYSLQRKIDMYKLMGKAEDDRHGFFLLKPKFREMFLEDKDLHLCGYLDRIHTDFDGFITIGDYKTSNKFGIGLPMDYKRQLALYSLLYANQEKKLPDFAAIIFLRFGEEYILEVTPTLLKFARETAIYVYERTRSIGIDDYPLVESNLCRWCSHYDLCSGGADYEKKIREERIKTIILETKKGETNEPISKEK